MGVAFPVLTQSWIGDLDLPDVLAFLLLKGVFSFADSQQLDEMWLWLR